VMAEVPASSSAATGGLLNMARALGTALGVAVTALGLQVANQHHLVGPEVVLGALAVGSIALAATTLTRPAMPVQSTPGSAR
jgi:hypothetical protein